MPKAQKKKTNNGNGRKGRDDNNTQPQECLTASLANTGNQVPHSAGKEDQILYVI